MNKLLTSLLWIAIGLAGAGGYAALAFHRGEKLNSGYLLVAALCTYAIGYRFYSKWLAARVLMLDNRRATPCEAHDDGKDFVKTNKWIVFGHHFAAISGPGPLVGPVLAAQFGYLPGALWILIGVVLGGAVQDFVVLFCSMRRNGRSLGQMVKEELNTPAGYIALIAILAIMIILLAVLALVVVKALAESPWGVFTVGATIPIAMLMGGYLRFVRIGKVLEASVIGVVLLLFAVWGGKVVYGNFALPSFVVDCSAFVNSIFLDPIDAAPSTHSADFFTIHGLPLAWMIIVYGLAASVLPVWLLLAPRDYLSTFMKLGTIFALAAGIFVVLPNLEMPALSRFVDGSGPIVAGKVFPFCFITIACGSISGFHTLIASGTTPKIITRESYARPIGYGAMCLESLVAIMALIAACTLEPGVYLSMNVKGEAVATAAKVTSLGFPVTVEQMNALATEVGEKTLFGRTGGAATLAVGMAHIFSKAVSGRWLDLWYHFAIMFEALFILTTLDAGTRVGRYILQDFLGNLWKPLGDTKRLGPNLLASGLMVCGWGYFLVQGVRDPLGGINSLWPLFGIANQMLAAIALCLVTTIILKTQLARGTGRDAFHRVPESSSLIGNGVESIPAGSGRPWYALVTLLPLVWLVAVTFTAGLQKIASDDPRIGFLAQAKDLLSKQPALVAAVDAARAAADNAALVAAEKALKSNRTLLFNNRLDAGVAAAFLVLVAVILLMSLAEWLLLLTRHKPPALHETPPVWLPESALAEGRPLKVFGLFALLAALARELSGEAELERTRQADAACACPPGEHEGRVCVTGVSLLGGRQRVVPPKSDAELYVEMTERRFNGVKRCC